MMLQLLKMGCDSQQQPASLQRGRIKNCCSLSQAFPGGTRNTEKEKTEVVGNKEKQQVATKPVSPWGASGI